MTGPEALALGGAIGAALTGGALFAFSNFVMRAFERVPPSEAIRAMQAINETVINPLFLGLLFGPAAIGLVFGAYVAGGVYLLGVVGVTMAGNVPLNDRLARLDPDAADAPARWRAFARPWLRYNHVRSVAAVASAAAFWLGA